MIPPKLCQRRSRWKPEDGCQELNTLHTLENGNLEGHLKTIRRYSLGYLCSACGTQPRKAVSHSRLTNFALASGQRPAVGPPDPGKRVHRLVTRSRVRNIAKYDNTFSSFAFWQISRAIYALMVS